MPYYALADRRSLVCVSRGRSTWADIPSMDFSQVVQTCPEVYPSGSPRIAITMAGLPLRCLLSGADLSRVIQTVIVEQGGTR